MRSWLPRASAAALIAGASLIAAGTPGRAAQVGPSGTAPDGATHSRPLTSALAGIEARNWDMRNAQRLKREWGIEVLGVRLASSHWMLTFRYRVVDPTLAAPLLDPTAKPYLIDEATGARLAVPQMENIGELRQKRTAVADRDYFVMFGNASKLVQSGSRVDVVIGNFHADGIIVQ